MIKTRQLKEFRDASEESHRIEKEMKGKTYFEKYRIIQGFLPHILMEIIEMKKENERLREQIENQDQ